MDLGELRAPIQLDFRIISLSMLRTVNKIIQVVVSSVLGLFHTSLTFILTLLP